MTEKQLIAKAMSAIGSRKSEAKTRANREKAKLPRPGIKEMMLLRKIDELLQAMWERSPERAQMEDGRSGYHAARARYIMSHREAVENAARATTKAF